MQQRLVQKDQTKQKFVGLQVKWKYITAHCPVNTAITMEKNYKLMELKQGDPKGELSLALKDFTLGWKQSHSKSFQMRKVAVQKQGKTCRSNHNERWFHQVAEFKYQEIFSKILLT